MAAADYISPALAARVRGKVGKLDRRILDVCAATGLRIGDVVALPSAAVRKALQNPRGWLEVRESKTGKLTRKRLPRALLEDLLADSSGAYCFPGRRGSCGHRSRQAVHYQIRKATDGWRGRYSAHSWRKMYAVELYRKTGSMERVQKALNHNDMRTTTLYAFADKLTGQGRQPAAKTSTQRR